MSWPPVLANTTDLLGVLGLLVHCQVELAILLARSRLGRLQHLDVLLGFILLEVIQPVDHRCIFGLRNNATMLLAALHAKVFHLYQAVTWNPWKGRLQKHRPPESPVAIHQLSANGETETMLTTPVQSNPWKYHYVIGVGGVGAI